MTELRHLDISKDLSRLWNSLSWINWLQSLHWHGSGHNVPISPRQSRCHFCIYFISSREVSFRWGSGCIKLSQEQSYLWWLTSLHARLQGWVEAFWLSSVAKETDTIWRQRYQIFLQKYLSQVGRKTQELANSRQLKTHLQMGCGAQVLIFSTLREPIKLLRWPHSASGSVLV